MRIIAGEAKGRRFDAPEGLDTRPTLNRVKESLFGILQFELQGLSVLDLFAGSGSLGLEALSRGAKDCVFCDSSPAVGKLLERNLKTLGYTERGRVLVCDYEAALCRLAGQRFDLVFADPPYRSGLAGKAAALLAEGTLLAPGGLLVLEYARSLPPEWDKKRYSERTTRKFGDTLFIILQRNAA